MSQTCPIVGSSTGHQPVLLQLRSNPGSFAQPGENTLLDTSTAFCRHLPFLASGPFCTTRIEVRFRAGQPIKYRPGTLPKRLLILRLSTPSDSAIPSHRLSIPYGGGGTFPTSSPSVTTAYGATPYSTRSNRARPHRGPHTPYSPTPRASWKLKSPNGPGCFRRLARQPYS